MSRSKPTIGTQVWSCLVGGLMLWLCVSCSVDEQRNPQRKPCGECEQLGGTCIMSFCLLPAGGSLDAGTRDAGMGADGGATVYASCEEEGRSELCYEATDQTTSLQPPCRAGTRVCRDRLWGDCEGQVLPAVESCNGEDDDCDGRVDEALPTAACSVEGTLGACSQGAQVCLAGKLECLQVAHPQTDLCNGEDDDCDGQVDEATDLDCYPNTGGCVQRGSGEYACTGSCTTGKRVCVEGQYAATCQDSVTPQDAELCTAEAESALDEDCDGRVDEGCTCVDGTSCYTGSPSTSQGRGICRAGTRECSDATHGTCTGEVTPSVEDCGNEGSDDDCDGVDDNIAFRGASCAEQSEAKGACKAGAVWQCLDGAQTCVDASPSEEVCDGMGIDEDCDGRVDEGFSLASDPNNCGACGVTCGAGLTCCASTCVNLEESNAHCSSCGKACAQGQSCCSGGCVNTKTDNSHCGVCDHACPLLNGCSQGSCRLL